MFDRIRSLFNKPASVPEAPKSAPVPTVSIPVVQPLPEPQPEPQPQASASVARVYPRKTSKVGIDLMHRFEGLARLKPNGLVEAYLCPAKVWTIGWGSTGKDPFNGGLIKRGTVWTRQQCDQRFEQHLAQFEKAVLDGLAGAPVTQAQFDAMVSLCYNIGPQAFANSTLLRKHKNRDYEGAARQFARWNKAGGRVLAGLTRRRAAEAALYRGQ